MGRADEVLEQLLASRRFQDSHVVSTSGYQDEPILRTGRQALAARPPERFRQMRAMSGRVGDVPSYRGSLALFYRQARFMADYADDQPYHGEFVQYYPTYSALPDKVLRGYFTWRAAFRAGDTPEAPLTFCFLYAYELLCGIGIAPGADGLAELARLSQAYGTGKDGQMLHAHLARWATDYVVYYGLDPALVTSREDWLPLIRAVSTLRRAEETLVAAGARGAWDGSASGLPTEDELLDALASASRYKIGSSKLVAAHRGELAETCAAVFARLVAHCARRRKTGLVDGLFGPPSQFYYAMFRNANFYAEQAHPDAHVQLTRDVAFDCNRGSWTCSLPLRHEKASAELGDILHEVDAALRMRLGDVKPLKPRELPQFERSIVDEEADRCVARRAEAAKPKVRIDLGQLASIRQAAARTREALLVDEEREGWTEPGGLGERAAEPPVEGNVVRDGVAMAVIADADEGTDSEVAPEDSRKGSERPLDGGAQTPGTLGTGGHGDVEAAMAASAAAHGAMPAGEAAVVEGVESLTNADSDASVPSVAPGDSPEAAPFGLAPKQLELVRGLLDGTFDLVSYQRDGTMATVEADAANETLFDLIGDTAIEFDGDVPHLVEDYIEDIREALS